MGVCNKRVSGGGIDSSVFTASTSPQGANTALLVGFGGSWVRPIVLFHGRSFSFSATATHGNFEAAAKGYCQASSSGQQSMTFGLFTTGPTCHVTQRNAVAVSQSFEAECGAQIKSRRRVARAAMTR